MKGRKSLGVVRVDYVTIASFFFCSILPCIAQDAGSDNSSVPLANDTILTLEPGTDISIYVGGPSRYLCNFFRGYKSELKFVAVKGMIDKVMSSCMPGQQFLEKFYDKGYYVDRQFINAPHKYNQPLIGNETAEQIFNNLVVGGRYKITLATSEILEGEVYSKTDTSLILDCDGTGYTFKKELLRHSELVSLPKSLSYQSEELSEADIISYEEIKRRNIKNRIIEIRIRSGQIFRGDVKDIDDNYIRLNIDGSIIPIGRQVIDQISFVANDTKKIDTKKKEQVKEPAVQDTVFVLNPQIDDYGRRKSDIVYVGKIVAENSQSIDIELEDGETKTILRDKITRLIKHTRDASLMTIQRYAHPLVCPSDMALVDVPPGKEGRPFFKVCIDLYEYPNKKDVKPKVNVSFEEAKRLCEQQGKRLCSAIEWKYGCSGLEENAYPYGNELNKEACNTEGSTSIEPSGQRNKCVSRFGLFDMVGNIFEWVSNNDGTAAAMGGPYSRCQTISAGGGGLAKPTTGFRCCKSN